MVTMKKGNLLECLYITRNLWEKVRVESGREGKSIFQAGIEDVIKEIEAEPKGIVNLILEE